MRETRIDLERLLVTAHVLAAVIGFGATFAYPVIQLLAEQRAPRHLPFALAAILLISRTVAVPGAAIVGLTGFARALTGPYSFRHDGWLTLSVPLYVGVFAAALLVLTPDLRRAQAEAELMVARAGEGEEPVLSREYRHLAARMRIVGGLVASGVIALVILMVLRPFAG